MDTYKDVIGFLGGKVKGILSLLSPEILSQVEEIRLRTNKPLHLMIKGGELFINTKGEVVQPSSAYHLTPHDLEETLHIMSKGSLYTLEEELRQGYLTLEGGHRVGFTGRGVLRDKELATITNIASFNIRITREILGVAHGVMQYLIDPQGIYSTLIISPPGAGKTTLLRDIARLLSDGVPELNFPGMKVGVVDERSEIGGAYQGIPQNRIGIRTDLLDGVPKSLGMGLLIRSLSPQVLITDELGGEGDLRAVREALRSGVKVMTSVHGFSIEEVKDNPSLAAFMDLFQRFLLLSRRKGPGTLEGIWDRQLQPLYGGDDAVKGIR